MRRVLTRPRAEDKTAEAAIIRLATVVKGQLATADDVLQVGNKRYFFLFVVLLVVFIIATLMYGFGHGVWN